GSRLADSADPSRMHSWAVVLFHPSAFYFAASGRQRFHQGSFHCAGGVFAHTDARLPARGQSKVEGRSERRPVFHARRSGLQDFVAARLDFLFSQTQKSAATNGSVCLAIAE